MPQNPRVMFVVGPTGSGKSDLAVTLAHCFKSEIVSCDSMLVYRGMNIGTAKPTVKEREGIRHHCIDLASPRVRFSVYQYRKQALESIQAILKKGKTPIVVGGSGLYVKSLIDGLAPQPFQPPPAVRKKLELAAKKYGISYLYRRLKKADPKRAREVSPNDKRRIIRALEIYASFKQKPSEWRENANSFNDLGYRWQMYGILRDRQELYDRINARVDTMMARGFINEVKRLKKIGLSQTARQSIGYFEVLQYLNGKIPLDAAIQQTKQRTRRLAKKQMTWFRSDERIYWIRVADKEHVFKAKQEVLKHWLK